MSKASKNQQPRRPRFTLDRYPDESAGGQPNDRELGRQDPAKFGSLRDETEKVDDYYGSDFSDDQYRE